MLKVRWTRSGLLLVASAVVVLLLLFYGLQQLNQPHEVDLSTLLANTPCSSLISEYTDKQGKTPTGLVLGFDASLSFQGTPGTTLLHTVNKHWVQIFPNNGNPFIDMCAGAVRVDRFGLFGGPPGTPLPCDPGTQKDATGLGGWITKDGTPAVCVGGMFWGIQGHTGIPSFDPQVIAWAGDGLGNRVFTISLGTVAADQPWYWDYKNGP